MDKKLSDNEIIKVLECCVKNKCKECPVRHQCSSEMGGIDWGDVLDLINRKNAEIEKKESTITLLGAFLIDYKNAYEKEKSKNIEELQRHIAFLREDKNYNPEKIRAEAIKEFAMMLKCGVPQETGVIRCADVDNLVKEMAGNTE